MDSLRFTYPYRNYHDLVLVITPPMGGRCSRRRARDRFRGRRPGHLGKGGGVYPAGATAESCAPVHVVPSFSQNADVPTELRAATRT